MMCSWQIYMCIMHGNLRCNRERMDEGVDLHPLWDRTWRRCFVCIILYLHMFLVTLPLHVLLLCGLPRRVLFMPRPRVLLQRHSVRNSLGRLSGAGSSAADVLRYIGLRVRCAVWEQVCTVLQQLRKTCALFLPLDGTDGWGRAPVTLQICLAAVGRLAAQCASPL